MFQPIKSKLDLDTQYAINKSRRISIRQAPVVLAATLLGALLMTGCQPQSATEPSTDPEFKTEEQRLAEDSEPMPQSDSAAARIEQFEPLYVAQLMGLQRRLQAEYESLQAADMSDSETDLLPNNGADSANPTDAADTTNDAVATNSATESSDPEVKVGSQAGSTEVIEPELNTSTEVGERDLTVLKRISLEPRKPDILTEAQIVEQYQQAMTALYQPVTTPINAEDTDTLITVATLIPQLFEHAEIANRLNAKSPALARLIIQHQVWEQIEAQQVIDMQRMKQDQKQEFEMLMTKFNETIKDYDEQIAKYEQTLKEFN